MHLGRRLVGCLERPGIVDQGRAARLIATASAQIVVRSATTDFHAMISWHRVDHHRLRRLVYEAARLQMPKPDERNRGADHPAFPMPCSRLSPPATQPTSAANFIATVATRTRWSVQTVPY